QLTFRSLCPEDLEQVSAIDSHIVGKPRRGFFEKRLTVAMAAPEAFITCAACADGKLKGYAFSRVQDGDFGSAQTVAVLDILGGVAPDAQGQGIGKALLSGIEQRMAKKNIVTLRSEIDWADHAMTGFFSVTGFRLAAIQIVARDTSALPERVEEISAVKMDSQWQVHGPGGNDYDTLCRDQVLIRSLKEEDLADIVHLDRKLSGRDRSVYYRSKFQEMLLESGIRVSLVAEKKGLVAGFIMARVDYGEFGKLSQTAVIDTIGVHPVEKGTGVGRALLAQLLVNLSILQVESLHTQIRWSQVDLHSFLQRCGFAPSQRLVLTKQID
ncbi:MAG: GNAT family N-acetyltransferase, partial [Deltaproteobacteria bacterium]|nr:GNAT family N-acetyltransferase [Deltaproteobacteria bacterium]